MHWGYASHNGPEKWGEQYPIANGAQQSPIDINVDSDAVSPLEVDPLTWNYVPQSGKFLKNNGHSWVVEMQDEEPSLSGGPLKGDIFKLEQFHCHWGDSDDVGSEHTINGRHFSAELHLVHWNTKYSSFSEAVDHPDGIAVLGIFFKVGDEHKELSKLTSKFDSIEFKSQSVPIEDELDAANFIPDSKDYFTYQGSLTTPPCAECVTWIVFAEPVEISEDQLNTMRTLKSYCPEDGCPCDEFSGVMKKNFRPTLPLGQRVINHCRQ